MEREIEGKDSRRNGELNKKKEGIKLFQFNERETYLLRPGRKYKVTFKKRVANHDWSA